MPGIERGPMTLPALKAKLDPQNLKKINHELRTSRTKTRIEPRTTRTI
jgi:hypothetical protein